MTDNNNYPNLYAVAIAREAVDNACVNLWLSLRTIVDATDRPTAMDLELLALVRKHPAVQRELSDQAKTDHSMTATHQPAGTAWMPAADQLPDPLQDVIVAAFDQDAVDSAIVDIGFYSGKHGGWCLTGVAHIPLDVRYWQPLPVAPKLQESSAP